MGTVTYSRRRSHCHRTPFIDTVPSTSKPHSATDFSDAVVAAAEALTGLSDVTSGRKRSKTVREQKRIKGKLTVDPASQPQKRQCIDDSDSAFHTSTTARPTVLEPVPAIADVIHKQKLISKRCVKGGTSYSEAFRGVQVTDTGSSGDLFCANAPNMRARATSDASERDGYVGIGSSRATSTSSDSERTVSSHEHGSTDTTAEHIERVESAGSKSKFFGLQGEGMQSRQPGKRRVRGPAKANLDPPPAGKRWQIQWNSNGCAIGDNATRLNRSLAAIAKMSKYWPLDKKWLKMDWTSYEDTWNLVVNDFDLKGHPNAWRYIFEVVRERHRGWKAHVKKKLFIPFIDNPSNLKEVDVDDRIDKQQFLNCVEDWLSEKNQLITHKNRANRACKKMNQTTGSRAFALVEEDMKKKNEGQIPAKVEFMARVYGSNTVIDEISEYVASYQSLDFDGSSRPLQEVELEAMEKVLGPDRSDRARLKGIGAERPPTFRRDRIERAKVRLEIEEKQKVQKGKLELKIEKLKKQAAKYANLMRQIASKVGVDVPDLSDSDDDCDDVSPTIT